MCLWKVVISVFFQIYTKFIFQVNQATEKQHNLLEKSKARTSTFYSDFQNNLFSLTKIVFDIKHKDIYQRQCPSIPLNYIIISLRLTQSFSHARVNSCTLFGRMPWKTNVRGWLNASCALSSQSPRRHRQQETGDASLEMLLVFEVSHICFLFFKMSFLWCNKDKTAVEKTGLTFWR